MKLSIHPDHPAPRRIGKVVETLQRGGVIAYPTDTVYGLGCDLDDRRAIGQIYQIKNKNKKSPLSIVCPDLKDIAKYAIVSDQAYRLMKRLLPGPYTIILKATKLVPRAMLSNQRTVGIRIPDHPIALAIVEQLGRPLVTSSIPMLPDMTYNDPDEIEQRLGHQLALVVDAGLSYPEPSTILDMTEMPPRLIRRGKGSLDQLGHIELVEALAKDADDLD